jgi:hypothetical protein
MVKEKLGTTTAISNAGGFGKIESFGMFSRSQFIYLWIENYKQKIARLG